jgi:pimeloyl-ACP methyl ester carboxylesterase
MLERSIPHATEVVAPRTAHLPTMERPGEFNQIVLGSLSGVAT